MVKKTLLVVILLVVTGLTALFIWFYVRFRNDPDPYKTFILPRVEKVVINVTSLSAEKTDLTLNIYVSNKLPFSFTADSFQYRIFINDAEVIRSRYPTSVRFPASDKSWIDLPLTVYNHDVDSVIKANEKRSIDSAEYKMNTTFFTNIIFEKRFDLTIQKFLPLIHLPELEVDRVEVDSLNFKRAALILHVALTNKNVFDIKLKDYSYEIQIEDHQWLKGIIEGVTVIKSKSTANIEVPVTLSFKEVSKTLFALLRKGKNVNYKLKLDLKMGSDQPVIKNSSIVIESAGSVKSVLKAVKGEPGK